MRAAPPRDVAVMTLALVLMLSGSVSAQTEAPIPTSEPLRLGSLSLYPGILVRDVGIDDNVYSDPDRPQQDFTYTVIPRLQAHLPVGSLRLVGASSLGFVYFQRFKDQQGLNGIAQGWLETDDSARIRPFASGSFMRSRDRVGDDIDIRALRIVTQGKAGLNVRTTPITSLTAWVSRDKSGFADDEIFRGVPLAQQLNRNTDTLAAGARFAVTPLTTIVVAAEFLQARFEGSPLRDADGVRVAPSVEFAQGAIINGRAAFGYREFNPVDSRLPSYKGYTGSMALSFSIRNMTRVDVAGNRDIAYSYDERDPYYMETSGRFTVSQRVIGPVEMILLAGRQRFDYQSVGGALFNERADIITTVGGGFGVVLGEQMRLTLTYDRAQRRSTGPTGRQYQRNRMMASIDYSL